jgi:hypothetical protein
VEDHGREKDLLSEKVFHKRDFWVAADRAMEDAGRRKRSASAMKAKVNRELAAPRGLVLIN